MSDPDPQKPQEAPALEDILVALQKSFSRLSHRTAKAPESDARALIVGKVNFEISLNAEPQGDQLRYVNAGGMSVKLQGQINTDIRIAEGGKGGEHA